MIFFVNLLHHHCCVHENSPGRRRFSCDPSPLSSPICSHSPQPLCPFPSQNKPDSPSLCLVDCYFH
uniref:Uncharacterized protein n=1 Tax=Brassica oleracea TaxID=3712 RepID=A0A3P6E7M2_BRAOL|nr:unnamed protein product [Brassica oleracea]